MFTYNLDIDEYVNYFLSGSFFVAMFASFHNELFAKIVPLSIADATSLGNAAVWITLIALAMFLGHFFSMVVRYVVRPIVNLAMGDPERAILPPRQDGPRTCTPTACSDFFTDVFCDVIAAKFIDTFGVAIDCDGVRLAVPRLIRSHVLHHSNSADKQRGTVIRARSFTANLAISFMASSLVTIGHAPWQSHAFLWIGAAVLITKQRSLDEREAKELYTHFLAVE